MVTFIIGNGFDIQMGLKTRYTDFYKEYIKDDENDSGVIRRFKNVILKDKSSNWETWADFELQMGIHSKDFTGSTAEVDFLACFEDFIVKFNDYIIKECDSVDWINITSEIRSLFRDSILNYYDYAKQTNQYDILANTSKLNFLQFNYTDIFDNLLIASFVKEHGSITNLHVHGTMGIDGHITMGVDNKEQIANGLIRQNETIGTAFVKPNYLNFVEGLNVNSESVRDTAIEIIDKSEVICVFGASIGETDKFWWEKVGDWLKAKQGKIIIYNVCDIKNNGIGPVAVVNTKQKRDERKAQIINKLARLAGLPDNWVENNPDRIFVKLDTDMFNFKLPKKAGPRINLH